MAYETIDVEDEFRADQDRFNVWQHISKVSKPTVRAYSMANYPEEKGVLKFNIGSRRRPGQDVPAGRCLPTSSI